MSIIHPHVFGIRLVCVQQTYLSLLKTYTFVYSGMKYLSQWIRQFYWILSALTFTLINVIFTNQSYISMVTHCCTSGVVPVQNVSLTSCIKAEVHIHCIETITGFSVCSFSVFRETIIATARQLSMKWALIANQNRHTINENQRPNVPCVLNVSPVVLFNYSHVLGGKMCWYVIVTLW